MRLIKFGLLGSDHFDIYDILKNNKLSNLILLYTTFTGKSIRNIDILKFIEYTNFYHDYYDLINEIIDKDLLNKYKHQLMELCMSKYDVGIITSIDELDNIEETFYKINEEVSNSDSITSIKNNIFLILIKNTYEEVEYLLTNIISSKKIIDLIDSNNLGNCKTVLKTYKVLVELLEEIYNMNDIEQLKTILKTLNTDLIINKSKYISLNDNFKDIKKVFIYLYGLEASSILTKIDNRESTEYFNINNTRYKTNKKEINGKKVDNPYVTYIEISEEAFFFQHVMNAYGSGGKIEDFKSRRAIGQSYICLSSTSNIKMAYLDRREIDINHVTLLFNDVKPSSLLLMNDSDLGSTAGLNDMNVTGSYAYFDTMRNILKRSATYSEYVFYREDMNGNILFPCGILVTGEEPNKYEIRAAKYLDIPLIKLLPVKVKSKEDNIVDSNINLNEQVKEHLEEVKKMVLRR